MVKEKINSKIIELYVEKTGEVKRILRFKEPKK